MNLKSRIDSFNQLGNDIREFLVNKEDKEWNEILKLAEQQNGWFTQKNIINTLKGIEFWLTQSALEKWLAHYPTLPKENLKPINVGVIMAGNIPLVGFHDFLCVLITGNNIDAKLSSSDAILLKFITKKLIAINPEWEKHIHFIDKLTATTQAVIVTGSNSTAKHFEHYFRNTPHIIRKNRNGVAILDGTETIEDIGKLGEDIFSYFGLGCRNISKLYIPENFDLANFFRGIEKFSPVVYHNKYANNYTYNRTIFLMGSKVFLDNNFMAVIEDKAIPSPIAVTHYERYNNLASLKTELASQKEMIQCVATTERTAKALENTDLPLVKLGETQSPSLMDYADGVDVIKFIAELVK